MNDDNTPPEIPETALDVELRHPSRNYPGEPSHKDHNRLTAAEEKRVNIRHARGFIKHPRKSRKYDGRALRGYRPRVDKVMKTFYDEIDLPEFKQALAFSKDAKFQMLLGAIANPRLAAHSFADLCRRCELTINDIADVWRNYHTARGMIKMMGHMPQVMEDVAVDSKSRVVQCTRCDGTGKLENEIINKRLGAVCPDCHGDGTIRLMGDKDARKLAFEATGLTSSVQQSQQVQVNVGMPSLEDMVANAEKALDIQATEVNGNGEVHSGAEEGPETDRKEVGYTAAAGSNMEGPGESQGGADPEDGGEAA